jgi:hypothetical protein
LKAIFKILKPLIKKLIIAQIAANEDRIITLILKTAGDKIPVSGEQLETTIKVVYDTLETVIANEIDNI